MVVRAIEGATVRYDQNSSVLMRSHSITFRVRYAECDPMGVAHHTAYPVWFEMGRTELLREQQLASERGGHRALTYRELEEQGVFLAVVSLNVRYKRPARYDDELTLRTTLIEAGHVKIEHEYELLRDSIVLARGLTTLACLDRNGRPRALPPLLCDPEANANR